MILLDIYYKTFSDANSHWRFILHFRPVADPTAGMGRGGRPKDVLLGPLLVPERPQDLFERQKQQRIHAHQFLHFYLARGEKVGKL